MKLCVIAGEASGDMHGAALLKELQEAYGYPMNMWGIGGPKMRNVGVQTLYDIKEMEVIGLWEVLKRYFFFKRVFDEVVQALREKKPDAILLIDYPGLNLRLAKRAKAMGIKVIYYICPQVWAWKKGRIQEMEETIDLLLTIFPFEPALFNRDKIEVHFVGHPMVNISKLDYTPIPFPGSASHKKIALLPGSRRQEIERLLPIMLTVIQNEPETGGVIAAADVALCTKILEDFSELRGRVEIVSGQLREVVSSADIALTASGTATLETALLGCPMCILYMTNPITFWVAKRVVTLPWIGMPNILVNKEMAPEFIQHECTPSRIQKTLRTMMLDPNTTNEALDSLSTLRSLLSQQTCSASTLILSSCKPHEKQHPSL